MSAFRLAFAVASAGVATACASPTSLPPLLVLIDGGAPPHGTIDASNGVPSLGQACASLSPQPTFCADFDEGDLLQAGGGQRWDAVVATPDASGVLDNASSVTPPASFHAQIPFDLDAGALPGAAQLTKSFWMPTDDVRVTFDVSSDMPGVGTPGTLPSVTLDTLELVFAGDYTVIVGLPAAPADQGGASVIIGAAAQLIEISGGHGSAPALSACANPDAGSTCVTHQGIFTSGALPDVVFGGQWTPVVVHLQLGATASADVTLGADIVLAAPLTLAPAAPVLVTVRLGVGGVLLSIVSAGLGSPTAVGMRFDDLTVVATPSRG